MGRRWLLGLVLAGGSFFGGVVQAADSWHYWRGSDAAHAQGVMRNGSFPIQWEFPTGAAWVTPLEGKGGSTPVVDGDHAFVTMGAEGKNWLFAFDLNKGAELWRVELGDDTGGKHKKGSGSNPSPVVRGDLIYAYYRSGDLACVNRDGSVVWQRNLQEDYGQDTLWWDLGSSPLLTEDALVVAVMQSAPSPSYLAGFDLKTGELSWKVERELEAPKEAAQSYTSPMLARVDDRDVIAVLGADHLTIHDASNGKELGRLGGFNPEQNGFFRSIASPVVAGNTIICPYARGESLTAVDMRKLMAGEGDGAIIWQHYDLGADVPTPAVMGDRVYLLRDRGTVVCLDVKTGETVWETTSKRNRNTYSSSPLIAGNHLYLVREDARVFVMELQGDEEPKLVADNVLTEDQRGRAGADFTVASPIPLDNGLLFRTSKVLVRINP